MENFVAFIFASAALAIIPGPDILFVLTQAVTNGKKAAVFTALGLGTGCLFHIICASFGISLIIKQTPYAFTAIKCFGFLYLLYLAYKSYTSKEAKLGNIQISKSGYLKGIIMCMLNPKVILFFLAFLPQFVRKNTNNFPLEMLVLGIIFDIISVSIFIFCAILASKLHEIITGNENFMKYVNKFACISYIIIALWVVLI